MPTLDIDRAERQLHFDNKVGTNIRVIRMRLDMTLETLAEQSDLPISMLSRIERGQRTLPLRNALLIIDAFDCRLEHLTG